MNPYLNEMKESVKRICFLVAFGFALMIGTAFLCKAQAAEVGQLNVVCFSREEIFKGFSKDDKVMEYGEVSMFGEDLEIGTATKLVIYNSKRDTLITLIFDSPEKGCILMLEKQKKVM